MLNQSRSRKQLQVRARGRQPAQFTRRQDATDEMEREDKRGMAKEEPEWAELTLLVDKIERRRELLQRIAP
jgi:hypothetical protein